MASVSVLYIDDDVVGPHLQLLRNVCEPTSRSRPHVTVRFFSKLPIPKEHRETTVTHIDLLEPASFNLGEPGDDINRTIYIRCRSDELVALEHKPHFPTSQFHVTIYDGPSREFANALLGLLREFPWGFRVPLPPQTHLTNIRVKTGRRSQSVKRRLYGAALERIFCEATGEHLDVAYLAGLSSEQRLELCRGICTHLHYQATGFQKVELSQRSTAAAETSDAAGQTTDPDVHLTPPELARDIAQYVVSLCGDNDYPVHFGDPAVGTGAFYSALLSAISEERIASAIGIDISERQAAAARWRWAHRGMEVIRGDYLHMERLPPRTLILANPPYLRHQRIDRTYKTTLRERASVISGMQVSARSGLYVYFMLLSHQWMAKGAIAAWLVPGEFLQASYGDALRQYLTHSVRLLRIHLFDEKHPQFENAKVLPALVVFRKESPTDDHCAVFTAGGRLSRPRITRHISTANLRVENRWAVLARLSKDSGPGVTIGDLFVVRRGIATGANEFFVLERETASSLGIPKVALKPLLPKVRTLDTNVIERCADGFPRVSPQLCLLDCSLSQEEIKRRYPRLEEYLKRAGKLGILERHLLRDRHPWYKQEPRDPAPFLCTYMGRGNGDSPALRFLWNKSDAVATNTYLMLYPREPLARLMAQRHEIAGKLFGVLQRTAQESMNARSRVHAEGLRKIEPSDLTAVPLTDAPEWLVREARRGLPLVASRRGQR